MKNISANPTANPWYREPWPWLLMAGPAIVVVAGFVTLGFAIESSDGLVADDYYRQGKTINMTIHRDQRARELGYRAQLVISGGGKRVSLGFAAAAPALSPLRLTLSHPTRSGYDREVLLARGGDGRYGAAFPALEDARWKLTLEDESRAWRLTGTWVPGIDAATLGEEK